jgi:hypothetical protein
MRHDPKVKHELERDIALTREVAERLSLALDEELQSQQQRARGVGAGTTLAQVDRDLAEATARLETLRAKGRELFLQAESAGLASGAGAAQRLAARVDALQRLNAEMEALRADTEFVHAEIAEIRAVRAELARGAL